MNVFKVIKRFPVIFLLACLATAALLLISEGSYRQSAGRLDEIDATEAVRMSIHALQRSILQAESSQRGYMLTSRKEYLQPYANALKEIDESFQSLDKYYREVPEYREVVRRLRSATDTRLSEVVETIRLHEDGKGKAATEIVLSDIGKEQMDTIRALTARLLAQETLHVAASRDDLYRTLRFNRIGVAALSIVSLLALFMVLRLPFMLDRRQQHQRRQVQAERDRLEIEVRQRTLQLTELTHHLQTAREDERHRLARDLHDELGALLTSAKLDAARIKSRLAGTAPEALVLLAHLVTTLNSGIALGRRIIEDLRPSALSNLGLVATLEILAREFADQSGVEVHCALESVELAAPAELMVYRLAQEAITNIAKYARASHVWLSLGTINGQVEVAVRDDGVGFDVAVSPRSAYGLMGMRFRVEAEGGTLTLVSALGQGTTIKARLPTSTPGTFK
jgi:signal transduction histidine kinase